MYPIIKKAAIGYHFESEHLTREAFWNIYKPGCDEHLVLHKLRKSPSYVPELDLVVFSGTRIVGHIISSLAYVQDSLDIKHEVLCVGPVSVLPSLQNKGYGAFLMKTSIAEARRLEYPAMILFGSPDYYHRFGFNNAENFGITTKDFQNFEAFMALELCPGALNEVNGRFFEDQAFVVNPRELETFEKRFPHKQKMKLKTQLF